MNFSGCSALLFILKFSYLVCNFAERTPLFLFLLLLDSCSSDKENDTELRLFSKFIAASLVTHMYIQLNLKTIFKTITTYIS